jgi:cytochrome c-type biogenesis protein CcmF
MLPIGLILLILTGIGPLLAWRKSTISNLVQQFLWPALLAVVTGVVLYVAGIRVWASGLCFALCAFVCGTIGQEFVRGAVVRKGATGSDIFTAMVGLVGRSRRRYGGYIVHVGIVLMFLGFAGQGFKQEEQVLLKIGQSVSVGRFTVRHDALRVTTDAQKQMITGHVSVFVDGKPRGTMTPARWFFNKHEEEPTTEVAIRRAPGEDLYVVLGGYDIAQQTATYAVTINPLVNWIWFGFAVMALGTGLALMPESAFAFAVAKVPSGAVTPMLLVLLLLPASLRAQGVDAVQAVPRTTLERQLEGEINCTCGCRRPLNNCGMPNCQGHAAQTAKLRQFLNEGKDHDAVIAAFIKDFGGQDILSAPVDKGFNRLAWLFPYLIGATGAAIAAFVAIRWSRHEATPVLVTGDLSDNALSARLDDELRDLD